MNPILDAIRHLNWIDLVFIIILLRILYIAFKTGFISEFFKLFGTLLAIYLPMHYYTGLSDFVNRTFALDVKIPLDFLDFFFFMVLVILGYLIGLLLREGFSRIIKLEAVPLLNKWGGLILGFVRTFFLVALITFCLFISTISHFRTQIGNSYMASRMLKVAPDTYGKIWYGIMSKFMPTEKFNPTISEIEKEF